MPLTRETFALAIDDVAKSQELLGVLRTMPAVEDVLNKMLAADPELEPEIEAARQHFADGIDAAKRLVQFLDARMGERLA